MPLVKAQCTNCGSNLEIDSGKEAAICPYCGTAYIVEKAIQNYNANSNVIITDHVQLNIGSAEELIKSGVTQLRIEAFNEAIKTYEELTQKYPQFYQGWLGLSMAKSRNNVGNISVDLICKAEKVANTGQRVKLSSLEQSLRSIQKDIIELNNTRISEVAAIESKREIVSKYERSKNNPKPTYNNKSISDYISGFFAGIEDTFYTIVGIFAIIFVFYMIGKHISSAVAIVSFLCALGLIIYFPASKAAKEKKEYNEALNDIAISENRIQEIDDHIRYICNIDNWEIDPYALLEP